MKSFDCGDADLNDFLLMMRNSSLKRKSLTRTYLKTKDVLLRIIVS